MKIFTLIFITLFLFSHSVAFGANPAPYTKEAYQTVERAEAGIQSKWDANLSNEDNSQRYVTFWRNLFVKAGYNYDDTIIKVVDDMRHNPGIIPNDPESVFTMVYVGLHIMFLECKHSKVECFHFFRPDSVESVKWLMINTDPPLIGR